MSYRETFTTMAKMIWVRYRPTLLTTVALVGFFVYACNADAEENWSVQIGKTVRHGEVLQIDYTWDERWRLSAGWTSPQTFWCNQTRKAFPVDDYYYGTLTYVRTWRAGAWLRPFVGLGVSIHEDRIPLLGGKWSLAPSLGVNLGDSLFLTYRHNSTASLTKFNIGVDTVQIGVRF